MSGRAARAAPLLLALAVGGAQAQSFEGGTHLREDPEQVATWNAFAQAVLALHERTIDQQPVRVEERVGGYGGPYGDPAFYLEQRYYDVATGRLLSWVQWERANPEALHAVRVNVYDAHGGLLRDYYAGYLQHFRNAPVQTLINLYADEGDLRAYRQFDASARRLADRCEGIYQGEPVNIDVENFRPPPPVTLTPAYTACFENLPARVDEFLDPLGG